MPLFLVVILVFSIFSVANVLIYQPLKSRAKSQTVAHRNALVSTFLIVIGVLFIYWFLIQLLQSFSPYGATSSISSLFFSVLPVLSILTIISSILSIRKILKSNQRRTPIIWHVLLLLGHGLLWIFVIIVLQSMSQGL